MKTKLSLTYYTEVLWRICKPHIWRYFRPCPLMSLISAFMYLCANTTN